LAADLNTQKFKHQLMQLPAQIDTGKSKRLIHCVVRELSDTGAKIILSDDARLPDEFAIVLTADGRVRRPCRILWRKATELAVRFLPKDLENSAVVVELD
jgi:hypothetical protein